MATAPVVPSAPAAAPPASSAPVSSPAPAPAPETSSAAAPTLSAGQLSGAEQIQPLENESSAEYLARSMNARLEAQKNAKPEGEVEAPKVTPEAEPPKVEAKPEDVPKPDAKEEKKEPVAGEFDDAFEVADEDLTLQPAAEPAFVGPAQLAQLAKDNPEFGKALEALPAKARNELYSTLRTFERGKEILNKFPTPKFADFALQSTRELAQFRDGFTALTGDKPQEAFQGILQSLIKESQLVGEDGQPIKDPVTGAIKTDGTFERFTDSMGQLWLTGFEGMAKATNDAELTAALNVIREKLKSPLTPAAGDDIPEHIRQREAEVKAGEEGLRRQQMEAMRTKRTEVETKLQTHASTMLDKRIDKILSKVEIPDFNREHATKDMRSEVMKRVTQNKDFIAQRDFLASQAQTPEIQKQRMELFADTVQLYLIPVANEILQKAGASKKQAIDSRREKLNTQKETSKNEPRGGGAQPTPQGELQGEAAMAQFETNFKKQNGRAPNTFEYMQFARKSRLGV